MQLAVVGCGFASYLYGGTLGNHAQLSIAGAFDCRPERSIEWTRRFGGRVFGSLEEILSSDVPLILNLTNPASHYEISARCLGAGKHVYSEKPLCQSAAEADELTRLAIQHQVRLSCAPCSLLGESAQTLWHAVLTGIVGRIHTAHVALCVPPMDPDLAVSWAQSQREGGIAARVAHNFGFPVAWPYEDEVRTGPALEHAAYALKWLTSWFGPVIEVLTCSSRRVPIKTGWDHRQQSLVTVRESTPDHFVSRLLLADDVEVLFVNSTVTSQDFRLALFGERGVLEIANQWDFGSPVWVTRHGSLAPAVRFVYPHAKAPRFARGYPAGYRTQMDYARGAADFACAIRDGVESPSSPSLAQERHVQEVAEGIAGTSAGIFRPLTTFTRRPQPCPAPARLALAFCGSPESVAPLRNELEQHAVCNVVPFDATARLDRLSFDAGIDVVVNLTDLGHRGRTSLALLHSLKHVVSEIPFAPTLEESKELIEVAQLHGLRLTGLLPAALSPAAYALGEQARAGAFGELRRIEIVASTGQSMTAESAELHAYWWLATWIAGPVWQITRVSDTGHPCAFAVTFAGGTRMTLRYEPAPGVQSENSMRLEGTSRQAVLHEPERAVAREASAISTPSRHFLARGLVGFCDRIREVLLPPHFAEQVVHQTEIDHLVRRGFASGRATARSESVSAPWMLS